MRYDVIGYGSVLTSFGALHGANYGEESLLKRYKESLHTFKQRSHIKSCRLRRKRVNSTKLTRAYKKSASLSASQLQVQSCNKNLWLQKARLLCLQMDERSNRLIARKAEHLTKFVRVVVVEYDNVTCASIPVRYPVPFRLSATRPAAALPRPAHPAPARALETPAPSGD